MVPDIEYLLPIVILIGALIRLHRRESKRRD